MTTECKTLITDLKHNVASTSRPNAKKQLSETTDHHTKKNEKRRSPNKTVENKEKPKTLQSQLQAINQECLNGKNIKPQKCLPRKVQKSKKESSTSTGLANQTETCMADIIMEKTRMLKNQQLQIEALTQQVSSLKEVINITKDMLEIRNVEVKQLSDKLHCMDIKFNAEKDRHEMMHSKLERMISINSELKNEYKKQLCMFSELQKTYQGHITNCKNQNKPNLEDNKFTLNNPPPYEQENVEQKPAAETVSSPDENVKERSLNSESKSDDYRKALLVMQESSNEINPPKGLSARVKGDTDAENALKSINEIPVANEVLEKM